ncbi:reverse transcriptase, putative [Ixodes scapularis]|uniref:Reverse transcriptase, putative n=1 Tax=Ixodes scapularis TaxID=6945 RepID=B7QGG1_IXOSC|nr:reverse transcriptase, putative [Ixodes scapularis]|eukprot:XP_002401720.1 reverse transcriptase, putative [Ixodes scapularis]
MAKLWVNTMLNHTHMKKGQERSQMCRAGCKAPESRGHILQRCHRSDFKRINRQNNIVQFLASRLRKPRWNIRVEPTIRTSQGRRFPDLVLPSKEQVVVRDVQVVGPRIGMSEALHLKVAKYSVPEVIDQVRGA